MPEGCVGMSYGKGLGVQREAIVFARHLRWDDNGLSKKPKVAYGGRSVESKEDGELL